MLKSRQLCISNVLAYSLTRHYPSVALRHAWNASCFYCNSLRLNVVAHRQIRRVQRRPLKSDICEGDVAQQGVIRKTLKEDRAKLAF
jgi:hypothetical protein